MSTVAQCEFRCSTCVMKLYYVVLRVSEGTQEGDRPMNGTCEAAGHGGQLEPTNLGEISKQVKALGVGNNTPELGLQIVIDYGIFHLTFCIYFNSAVERIVLQPAENDGGPSTAVLCAQNPDMQEFAKTVAAAIEVTYQQIMFVA